MRNMGWMGIVIAALCVGRAGATAMPTSAEASVLVTGTVEVAPDGRVTRHAIDNAGALDLGVVDMIDDSMSDWRFKPMHGTVSAVMRLVLHARKNAAGKYVIWIASADFKSPQDCPAWGYASKPVPPEYPREALEADVSGTVYVALHLNRDGKVVDAIAEQVNLNVNDFARRMDHWRDQLGTAAVVAARDWHFSRSPGSTIVSDTDVDSEAARTIRVPVAYRFDSESQKYGLWEVYVPGPKHPIPWIADSSDTVTRPEALAAGGIYPVEHAGLQLVTKLASD
jgi:hypothetical protein